jgi:hypothetical protein
MSKKRLDSGLKAVTAAILAFAPWLVEEKWDVGDCREQAGGVGQMNDL